MRLGQHATSGGRLHRLGFVSVYAVGEPGDRRLAKAIESDGLPVDEILIQASHDLRAAAALQRLASDVPGIARVLEVGDRDGKESQAYAIYERYDDNARLLLGRRARPDAATTLAMLERLRRALAGFAAATTRPHGNATLSNILINAARDGGTPEVGLTDPLPAIADTHRAAQADRRALGGFLLALVTGRAADTLRSVEVPPDHDWAVVFGAAGASHARRLCHALLFDGSAELPTADELEQALRYRPGPINRRTLAAAGTLLVLAVAASVAWVLTRPPSAPTAQLADAAAALARYPTTFRRFVQAQDPESAEYHRMSEFLVLLGSDPWSSEAERTPPTGPGTVHAIYKELQEANQTLATSQLGRTSSALEGLWRAIASTPDDAPLSRWDSVARAMLAPGQDQTSRHAQFMFGAIKAMADDFDQARQAAADFTEAQRQRLDSVRGQFQQHSFTLPMGTLALLDAEIERVHQGLAGLLAVREAALPGEPADPAVPAESLSAGETAPTDAPSPSGASPASAGDGTALTTPGNPQLTRVQIAELFDSALALEHLLLVLESELGRPGDLGEPVQLVHGLRGDAFAVLAPPAFRDDARPTLALLAASFQHDYDAAVSADLTRLLRERARQDRWDTRAEHAGRFEQAAALRQRARQITDRLRTPGVVAELGWMAAQDQLGPPDGAVRAPGQPQPLSWWASLLERPRLAANPEAYSIEAHLEQLERWARDLRGADEASDPRYAALHRRAESALHAPQQQREFAHWPTSERHRVVAAAYDELLEEIELAVRTLDPCYPFKAEFIPRTLAEAQRAMRGESEHGLDPESAALIRWILETAPAQDPVRADRSARPAHPKAECANAARFAERVRELRDAVCAELASGAFSEVAASPDHRERALRVYHAGLRGALSQDAGDGQARWTPALSALMFEPASPAARVWPAPDAVVEAVSAAAAVQASLHEALSRWAWADPSGFAAMQSLMDSLDSVAAAAQASTPPVPIDAARDEAWDRDRIAAARLLAAEHWLCSDHPTEQEFRRAIIAGALPEEVLPADLLGNWLRDDAEFAFLWVRRRNGCPIEPWPIPGSSRELIEAARLIEVMQNAISAAPVDAKVSFPELEQLPDRLQHEGLAAAIGYATLHMRPEDWLELATPDSPSAQAQRDAFAVLGMPLAADAGGRSRWLEPPPGSPTITPRVRANWALWHALVSLHQQDSDDEPRARAVVDALAATWTALSQQAGASDATLRERASAMAQLPAQLSARPPDFTLPGALPAGWQATQAGPDWQRIDVAIPGHGTHRFIGVSTDRASGYPTAYVAREELSLDMVNALLDTLPAERREAMVRTLEDAAAQSRSLLAPTGWTIQNGRVVPADPVGRGGEVEGAMSGQLSSHGWFSLLPRRDGSFASLAARLPALPGVRPPTPRTPLQMVPPDAVIALLSAVPVERSLRLPTLEEWARLAGPPQGAAARAGGSLNLRDRSFYQALLTEVEFFDQEPESARFVSTFRVSRTARDGVERVLPMAATRELGVPLIHPGDDGHALFMPVDEGGWATSEEPTRLRHAFGNVAEVVATPGAELTHAVVGGSALSAEGDFGADFVQPIGMRPRDLSRPFADVGFRVVIPSPDGQPYTQVAIERLRSFGFMPPAGSR